MKRRYWLGKFKIRSMKGMNFIAGPIWIPLAVAIYDKIMENKQDSNLDFSRPIGRCASCGHKTYMLKGSCNEEVCSHCGLTRILVLQHR